MTDREAERALNGTGFFPKFCDEVDPDVLLPHLALARPHVEEVINKSCNKSKHSACQILWGHICRMPGWPEILAQALRVEDYKDLYRILAEGQQRAHLRRNNHSAAGGANRAGGTGAGGVGRAGGVVGAGRPGGIVGAGRPNAAGGANRAGGAGGPPPSYEECIYQRDRSTPAQGAVWGNHPQSDLPTPPDAQPGASLPCRGPITQERGEPQGVEDESFHSSGQAGRAVLQDSPPPCQEPCLPPKENLEDGHDDDDDDNHDSNAISLNDVAKQVSIGLMVRLPTTTHPPHTSPPAAASSMSSPGAEDVQMASSLSSTSTTDTVALHDEDDDGDAVSLNDVAKQVSSGLMVRLPKTTQPFHTSPSADASSMSSPGAEDVQMASSLSSTSTTDTVALHDEDEDESIAAQDAPPSPSSTSTIDLHEDEQRGPSLNSSVSSSSSSIDSLPGSVHLHADSDASVRTGIPESPQSLSSRVSQHLSSFMDRMLNFDG